jgi:hypothetical protein
MLLRFLDHKQTYKLGRTSLMFVPCIIGRSRSNQRFIPLFCSTYWLLHVSAVACHHHIPYTCITHFNHILTHCTSCHYVIQCALLYIRRLYRLILLDTPPIRFVFHVTQKDLRSYLMMAGYYRNM